MIRLCTLWADCWMFLVGMPHRNIFEVPHDFNKPYIYVANHLSYIDAVLLVKAIRKNFRPLGRAETAQVPIFGFIYRRAIVTVDRSDPKNRAASVSRLKALLRKGVSIFVFPEGTFNMTTAPLKSFYDGAFRIAIETGTPIKPLLFLDGYHRMHYSHPTSISPGQSRAVFLEEITVEGYTMEQLPALKSRVMDLMEQKLKSYHAAWINT
ncbi:1-acyl-sn-glycerol-3-phosphate acyltransferase [Bacteroidota bacterium]|nr:1-acyl-sn-glycerol-3-phosphate acyltransferase [Bacteroidota bacterium]